MPPRTILPINEGRLTLYTMPAYGQKTLSCKLVTQCPENEQRFNSPSISALLVLFNVEDGKPEAIMDAKAITAWRTAAGSLVAFKHLGKNQDLDGKTLSVLGAGKQGKIHIIGFQRYFQFGKVNLWNRTRARAEAVKSELKNGENIEITVYADVKACVKNADVVIWAGSATHQIYITQKDLKPGTLIISVGTSPSMPSGLSAEIFQNAQLFTESEPAAKSEMSTFIETHQLEFHELGQIISATKALRNSKDFIVYQSLGSGAMDAAAGKFILNTATQTN